MIASDKTSEVINLQTQFNDTKREIADIGLDIGDLQSETAKIPVVIDAAAIANNKADISLLRMSEANDKVQDIEETDTPQDAFDKVFPI